MRLNELINMQVVQSVTRFAIDKAGMLIIGHGWVTGTEWEQIAGLSLSIITLIYSMASARMKNEALKVAGNGSAAVGKQVVLNSIEANRENNK